MKLFNHTAEQQANLVELLKNSGQKLTGFMFNDVAKDQEMLRQHAYIKGQYDLLITLLNDDFDVPQPANQTTES